MTRFPSVVHCLRPAIPFLLSVVLAPTSPARSEAASWRAAEAPLMTRWASQVSPTNVLTEYPRPQLARPDWLNLNGLWDYAITPLDAPAPSRYEGQILVPFPVESALSGVMRRFDENSLLWYRRAVVVPPDWRGRRVRLHFGAVDWQARLFVNGQFVGEHRGGYDAFSFDVTDRLLRDGTNEIVVAVSDPTEGDQPRGKQSRKPEGIFYTPSSGIWQTVWLEPVPAVCVGDLRLTPDLAGQALSVRASVNSLSPSLRVEAVALADGQEVGRITGLPNAELRLPVPAPRAWSPDTPFLYDLRVVLTEGGRVLDTVSSYFGMRSVALTPDSQGLVRLAVNGEFLFQIGTLDQGFWPDGLYTAPTDEALRSDLEFLKRAGFNVTRKHVKVEPERWYYWCDKLGLLVWQDMPSGNNATAEGRREFETELLRLMDGLHNHPSIITWVLFNEGWGQHDTARLADWVKALDPSRLVDNASGWTDARVGDLIDLHSYVGPDMPEPDPRRAAVLGEFGGLGLKLDPHDWSPRCWAYSMKRNGGELTEWYVRLLRQVWTLHDSRGLSAAIYTQTTDVETECNGLLTYDRAVIKPDLAAITAANRGAQRTPPMRVVLPDALLGRATWQCAFEKPPADWFKSGFDASGWKESPAGFGTAGTPGAICHTTWDTADIWLRRSFVLAARDLPDLQLHIHHDEDAEVYLNGVLAARLDRFTTDYTTCPISSEAAATLKPGANLVAVHCHQTIGGQYIDVGLVQPQPAPGSGNRW